VPTGLSRQNLKNFDREIKKNKKISRKGVDRMKGKWFLGCTPGNGWIFGRIY
jgi:hypothetical protein